MHSYARQSVSGRLRPSRGVRGRTRHRLLAAVLALAIGSLVVASAAPADPPTTPILDNFNRPNEDPLSQSGAWSPIPITGSGETLEVVGNAVAQNEGETVPAKSFRVQQFSGDVEVHARIAVVPNNFQEFNLFLHLQNPGTASVQGYGMQWLHWFPNDAVTIQKWTNGTPANIAGPVGLAKPVAGDTFLLRRVGQSIQLWLERSDVWTNLLSANDGAYNSGHLGLGNDDEFGRWDDFGGGALGAPPPSGPPPAQSFGASSGGRGISGNCACGVFADPVSSRTGAFTTTTDDLDLPGTGVSFAWGRGYTSADTTVGRLGPGWIDSYAASLAIQPNGDVVLRGEDGQQLEYTNAGGGSFTSAPGALSTLEAVAGGYELVRTDQVVYRFDSTGRLLSVKDRHGQGVTLGYDALNRLETITDSASRQATVSYNAENLVSEVEAADGRSVAYGYTAGRLTSVTDVRGKPWTYTYDAGGRLESIIDPLGHEQVTNVYGADARVVSQTDALGKETTFGWNAQTETATATDANDNVWTHDYENGVLVSEVDPLLNDTEIAPDDDFNTASVTGPTGETTEMTYDEAGNVLSATAPASLGGVQKTFEYNARNDVELVTDAAGNVTDYAYDPATGDLTSVTQDDIEVGSYTYDEAGRVETFTDGNEKTWTYTYVLSTGYLESSTDPLGNKTTYTYDDAGRVLTRVDPKGNVAGCNCAADFTWTYTYDDAGNQLTEENPLGHTTTNVYDDAGRLSSTTDALGRTTSYTYDDADRVLTETAPDPDSAGPLSAPVTSYTYDDVGNKLTETDPRGNTTTFAYDDANRLISTTAPDPDGAGPLTAPVTTHAYDANGNLASSVEPRGNVQGANPNDFRTTFTHDAAGRMLTETAPDPDGAGPQTAPMTTNVYDAVGSLESVTDANNHETSYTHDAAGRILTVIGPDGGLTTYTYDDAGNLLTRRDDNNHTTTFTYDDAGRLASETSPDPDGPGPQGPAVTTHTYDPNGNQLTLTDPNGNASLSPGDGVTTYGYDRANRQTSIDYSDSTPDVTFTLDAAGNQLTMSDGAGTETRTYDNLDRVLTVTRGSDTFSYEHDASSNVTRRTYPGNTDVHYAYDPLNRLGSVSTSSSPSPSNTTSYTYDPASNLAQTTLPSGNGYVETRAYDRAGRLTELNNQRGSTVLSRFVSTLDPAGNPLQVVRTGGLNQTQTYTYDAADRITGVCFQAGTCPGAADPFTRWTYDKVGNRLSEQQPTGTTSYTYDARDRLLSAGATSFSHDANGNQTQKGTRTFAYDLANRLKSTTANSTTISYAYDGQGKRVEAIGGGTPAAPTLRTPCPTAIGTSGTATVGKPSGTVVGDLLIVGLAFEKGWDVAITPPAGWTLIRRTNQSSNVGYATYRKTAGGSEPASYAFTLTNSPKWSIGACAIAGADTTTPIDVQNDASGVNGNPSAPSVTTTGANRLVLAFYANKKPVSYSSYTAPAVERWDRPNTSGGLPSNAMASYTQAAAGATGAKSAAVGEQAEWVAQQIAIAPAPAPSTTRFLWDTNHSLPELALERDASGSLLRRYLYGNDLDSLQTPAGSFYYHTDALGSITNLTDAIGATQWTYSYEPFGTSRTQTQDSPTAPANPMRFTGDYEDSTGLYHLRARQYDPATGRFLRLDPAAGAAEDPMTSGYVYAGNMPTQMVDPSGLTFRPARIGVRAVRRASTREVAPSAVIPQRGSECLIEESLIVRRVGANLHAEVEATCTGVSAAFHQGCIAMKETKYLFWPSWSNKRCGRIVHQTLQQRYNRQPIRAFVRRKCEKGKHKYRSVSILNVQWISGRWGFFDTPGAQREFRC
jgi:RHS repeat-associated protein